MRWFAIAFGLGVRVGLLSGSGVGLLAGVGGVLFGSSLPDVVSITLNVFWVIIPIIPVAYLRGLILLDAGLAESAYPGVAFERGRALTAIAWLPAVVSGVVAFMIPVVMTPIVLNRGVTLETSASWYDQVYTPLLNGRVWVVAVGTLLGFALIGYMIRGTRRPDPQ